MAPVRHFEIHATDPGVALPRVPVPSVGWLARVKDPDGRIVGTMQTDPAAK